MKKIESNPNVLGGTIVFEGTRLPVLEVGRKLHRADGMNQFEKAWDEAVTDYPYLDQDDLVFALQFAQRWKW